MKFILKTIEFAYIVLTLIGVANAKEWRGIVPLRSTRADVEHLLGKPKIDKQTKVFYTLKSEEVSITYSTGSCTDKQRGWNVPRDVVESIWITPKSEPKFAELKLDESKYRKVNKGDVLEIVTYTNDEEGIDYVVDIREDVIQMVMYWPAAKDDYLRCPPPPENPDDGIADSQKFDEYSNLPFEEEKKHLSEFATQLQYEQYSKGYIIAYSGRVARAGEAQARADRAKNYLVNKCNIEASRIVTIDGGYRETVAIELWVRPNGRRAPAPARGKPDIPEVRIGNKKLGDQTKCKF